MGSRVEQVTLADLGEPFSVGQVKQISQREYLAYAR